MYHNRSKDKTFIQERNARGLEETMERMQGYSNFLHKKIKRLERQGKKPRSLKAKLVDVNAGIIEVFGKADSIWKEIRMTHREGLK